MPNAVQKLPRIPITLTSRARVITYSVALSGAMCYSFILAGKTESFVIFQGLAIKSSCTMDSAFSGYG
jgi:hypothetical protein